MTNEEHQVRRFYEQIWNQHNHKIIPEVLDENMRFRGSLGLTKYGHSEFKEYLDMVHEALGGYQCKIDDLVCEPNKVFARMTFTGIHKGEFLGFPPTGKRVTWSGAALFTFEGGKVIDLWVLGDLISLERQLKEARM
jgi:predicted ester cyclase